MRSKIENVCLSILRVIFMPVAVLGVLFIWIYILATLGFDRANETISEILEL